MNMTNTTTVIKSMYHFMIGFVGGLFGDKAPNTMACTSNFTRIANNSLAMYNHVLNAVNATYQMNELDITNKTTYNQTFPKYQ